MSWVPRIGAEFAGYKLDSLLGHGGMSIVYRAEHLSLGRTVALKLLAPQLSEDQAFRERFTRESRLAASLDHPNIIPIYEAGEEDGVFWIAMRYVDGSDAKNLLKQQGPLDPERAVDIIAPVASALGAAHGEGPRPPRREAREHPARRRQRRRGRVARVPLGLRRREAQRLAAR